jgi:hypothetical protein
VKIEANIVDYATVQTQTLPTARPPAHLAAYARLAAWSARMQSVVAAPYERRAHTCLSSGEGCISSAPVLEPTT